MFKKNRLILVLALWGTLPSAGNTTNCSCWTTLGGRSSGSICKLYTEGEYSYTLPECQGVCKFAGGNTWAYIDSAAYGACTETFKVLAKVTCTTPEVKSPEVKSPVVHSPAVNSPVKK